MIVRIFSLLGLMSALFWTAGCERKTETSATAAAGAPIVLRFGHVGLANTGNIPEGPVGYAYTRGLLEPALAKIGISKVEFVRSGGPTANQVFAAGQIDVYQTGETGGIIGKGAGLDIQLINIDKLEYKTVLIGRKDGPATVKELAGKKVSGGMVGTNGWHYVHELLKRAGIRDKVELVTIPLGGGEAALLRGDIDAYGESFYAISPEARGFRVLDNSNDHEGLSGLYVTVGGRAFLERHPEFAGVFNEVVAEAVVRMRANPDDFYAFMKTTSNLSDAALREHYPLRIWSTDPVPARGLRAIEYTKAFLLDERAFRKDFDLQAWIAPNIYRGLAQPSAGPAGKEAGL
ncbi:MAG: ABC transporter substrate-binding protein [Rariglobus sp.]